MTDGTLNVDFDASVDNTKISAVEVTQVGGSGSGLSSGDTVTADAGSQQSAVAGETVELDASGSTASGVVWGGGVDEYTVSGDLTDLSVDGDATVYVDGEPVDPASVA